ncbi:transposase [Ottowia sp.]|uniref:transposase n=1 Tax=Ottowia sp. TaxID=1898956 RepID=UPI0026048234|nr:transposase [Ottowia sp.]
MNCCSSPSEAAQVRRPNTFKRLHLGDGPTGSQAAFDGVTPRLKPSGSFIKARAMMSRTGHADMRRALSMPAPVARRDNAAMRVFGDRLRAAGLAPKAVVGACMHKLGMLINGALRSGKPFDLKLTMPALDVQDGI